MYRSVHSLLDRLLPLFVVDPLTSRAFLYVVSLEDLVTVRNVGKPFEIINALEEKATNILSKSTSWFCGNSDIKTGVSW